MSDQLEPTPPIRGLVEQLDGILATVEELGESFAGERPSALQEAVEELVLARGSLVRASGQMQAGELIAEFRRQGIDPDASDDCFLTRRIAAVVGGAEEGQRFFEWLIVTTDLDELQKDLFKALRSPGRGFEDWVAARYASYRQSKDAP